jgi:hypothetical protein
MLTLTGQHNHAGTTQMALRRDAFQGLSAFNACLNERLRNIVMPQSSGLAAIFQTRTLIGHSRLLQLSGLGTKMLCEAM